MRSVVSFFGIAIMLVLMCSSVNGERKSLNVLTYNAMLPESVSYKTENRDRRFRKITNALKKSDADLICLQEVFFGTDVENMVKRLEDKYPYSFSYVHNGVSELPPQKEGTFQPPCPVSAVVNYDVCMSENNCKSLQSVFAIVACAFQFCTSEATTLFETGSSECLECVTTSLQTLVNCAGERPIPGGRNMNMGGLILLSKAKLTDAVYRDYHPKSKMILTKGYIQAKVDFGDMATVACTHLTEGGDVGILIETDLMNAGFKTYSDVNRYETQLLIKRTKTAKEAIVLGDFNSGVIFQSGQDTVNMGSYRDLLRAFTTRPSIGWTYRGVRDRRKMCLDHVFTKNLIMESKAERVFVPPDEDLGLSDHNGVQVTVMSA